MKMFGTVDIGGIRCDEKELEDKRGIVRDFFASKELCCCLCNRFGEPLNSQASRGETRLWDTGELNTGDKGLA